jgi:hypothetical protein
VLNDASAPKVDDGFLRGWSDAAACLGVGRRAAACNPLTSIAHRRGYYTKTLREWSRTSYGRGYVSAVLAAHGMLG